MNIFFLHDRPNLAAEMHGDKHVGKMLLESAQMLFTAVRQHGYTGGGYKSAYENHPMTKWVAQSYSHANWALEYAIALSAEFIHRYGHAHKTSSMLPALSVAVHVHMPDKGWRNPPRCMPDEYKVEFDTWDGPHSCHVESYRRYYADAKRHLHKFSNRPVPQFLRGASLPETWEFTHDGEHQETVVAIPQG